MIAVTVANAFVVREIDEEEYKEEERKALVGNCALLYQKLS